MAITTKQEFEDLAENWYQRTHKLREVWQAENCEEKRKQKAFKLWETMVARMLKVTKIYTDINMPRPPKNFQSGGVSFKN